MGADPFIAATLLAAMRQGLALSVGNPASPRLLRSADRIQEIFHAWDRSFVRVAINAQPGTEPSSLPARGVACFFSGGVDSFYTILKHRSEIDQLICVHGFDVRRRHTEVWQRVIVPVRAAAEELGLPLIEVETNLQEFSEKFVHWNFYFGAALASVALALSPVFRKVYIPAGFTYADLIPWGSSPLVDPLWSSEDTEIVHDGCEAGRVEKVAQIAGSQTVLKYLRVCYENRKPEMREAYNCGQCEKCLRTKINLYLAGVLDRCSTFDHALDLKAIARMRILTEAALPLAQENLEAATKLGADPALIRALQLPIDRYMLEREGIDATGMFDRIERLRAENYSLDLEIKAIRDSRSWRVTAPLRALTDGLRQLLRFRG